MFRPGRVSTTTRRFYSSVRKPIRENDVLLLHQKSCRGGKFTLTPPLRPGQTLKLSHGGTVSSDLLLTRHILDAVSDSRGCIVDLHTPSLPAHVHLAPNRPATPIYAQDAALITSLLDLHPDGGEDAPGIEVFEAGTGIGGLTLHLARAVHAANPPVPRRLREALARGEYRMPSARNNDKEPLVEDHHEMTFEDGEVQEVYREWMGRRKAVVHSVDIRHSHSRYAHRSVGGFRQAQYLLDVSFHVCQIDEYLGRRVEENGGKPFLDAGFLDLPGPEEQVEAVVRAMKPDATLLVFAPSITQIARVARWADGVGGDRKPVRLEKTLELPMATNSDETLRIGTGGKEWDVRYVKTKEAMKMAERGEGTGEEREDVLVCRPMVYQRIVGGGFIGVFRRLLDKGDRVVYEGSLDSRAKKPRLGGESKEEETETGTSGAETETNM